MDRGLGTRHVDYDDRFDYCGPDGMPAQDPSLPFWCGNEGASLTMKLLNRPYFDKYASSSSSGDELQASEFWLRLGSNCRKWTLFCSPSFGSVVLFSATIESEPRD